VAYAKPKFARNPDLFSVYAKLIIRTDAPNIRKGNKQRASNFGNSISSKLETCSFRQLKLPSIPIHFNTKMRSNNNPTHSPKAKQKYKDKNYKEL
jgi:hypothetical protein